MRHSPRLLIGVLLLVVFTLGMGLVGSLVVCVCNFAPRNIGGFMSEVLILGA